MDHINKSFEEIRALGVACKAFNSDALNREVRLALIQDISELLPQGDKIKILVHSIAKGSLKPMFAEDQETLSDQDLKITFDAMALSLYTWTKALIKANLFAQDTRIISFTSEGNKRVSANYAAVSVAKVALEALTRNMALEFASLGIKANCIQAGITHTKAFEMIPGYKKYLADGLERNPHNRLTTPEDVANAVYLLTTDEAQWITGTIIKVDGGESLK
jgi:enoyl-[acyl-carrier protein] reductase I